jgi:hypothetical protein
MELYGSQLFSNIKFRDSFVMIGQRGIPKGKAIELVIFFSSKMWSISIIIIDLLTVIDWAEGQQGFRERGSSDRLR